jgi:phosphoglycolate phosphatase
MNEEWSKSGRPKAVVFDWDNTLVDSWAVIHDALNVTLTTYGLPPWTLDETRDRVRHSMRDSFPLLFGDRWEEAGRCFYARYDEIHMEKVCPLPGAGELLKRLSESGIYLGVVSNKLGKYLRAEAEHLGWHKYFGRIVGALDAPRDKPAPDCVEMALAGSGICRGPDVWFAGDTSIDLECAVNAGCVPVLVRGNAPNPGEFKDFPPQAHVANCLALGNLVLKPVS